MNPDRDPNQQSTPPALSTAHLVGFAVLPLVLLIAAWGIATLHLWSPAASLALPWLLSAVAVAVMLLGVVCLVLQVPPTAIPPRTTRRVLAAILAIFAVALMVDVVTFLHNTGWTNALAGWLGFAAVLSGVFALPYAKPDRR